MEVGRARINWRIFEARCIPPLFQQQQGSNCGQFILKRNNWVLLATKGKDKKRVKRIQKLRALWQKNEEKVAGAFCEVVWSTTKG